MTNVTAGAWTGGQPAANMTWYEAAAFVNFLNTSTGHQAAYQLDASNTTMTLWSSAQAWQVGGENLYRHKDAFYFLPSEDEWYKAAFHKNDGVTANYWDYATGSNTIPTAVASGTGAGTAVYNIGATNVPATVDNDGGLSPYGTRGQNGNVYEWQESALIAPNDSPSEQRVLRGGYWGTDEFYLRSSINGNYPPTISLDAIGFRVASVPEPSSAVMMIGSGLIFLLRRRREDG
jgi:formylglycine-generating enzyme required for sulfatase activity